MTELSKLGLSGGTFGQLNYDDAELAEGIAEDDVSVPGIRRLLAMSNLSKSVAVHDRDTLWQITHRTLDLNKYIESCGKIAQRIIDPYMEEMVVIGGIFDHMPTDPAEFSVDDIKSLRTSADSQTNFIATGITKRRTRSFLN